MVVWWTAIPLSALVSVFVFEQNLAAQEQVIQLVCAERQAPKCDASSITSEASSWIRWMQMGQGLGSLLVVSLFGAISDSYGRRPVIVSALIGFMIVLLPSILVEHVEVLRSVWRPVLIAGWTLSGFFGGVSIFLLSVFGYAADLVPEHRRGAAFTVVEAAIGIGGAVGTFAGGYIVDGLGLRALFWGEAGLLAALLLYTLVLLPESLSPHLRVPMNWRTLNCFTSLTIAYDNSTLRPRAQMLALLAPFSLGYLSVHGIDAVMTPLLSGEPYSWSASRIGLYNAMSPLSRLLGGFVLTPLLAPHIHGEHGELLVVRWGMFAYGAFICASALGVGLVDFCAYAVGQGTAAALAYGYLRGIFSNSVGADQQGRMLSCITFIASAAQIVSPLLFNTIYSLNVSHPWLTLYLLGLAPLAAALSSLFARAMQSKPRSDATRALLPGLAVPTYGSVLSINADEP